MSEKTKVERILIDRDNNFCHRCVELADLTLMRLDATRDQFPLANRSIQNMLPIVDDSYLTKKSDGYCLIINHQRSMIVSRIEIDDSRIVSIIPKKTQMRNELLNRL
jgi:RNA polymerase subunit RPABC4/transcription elongation factor Spt4